LRGQPGDEHPLQADATVQGMSFRKLSGATALQALCALTAVAGPLPVYDPSGDQVFAVRPNERAEDLAGEWPRQPARTATAARPSRGEFRIGDRENRVSAVAVTKDPAPRTLCCGRPPGHGLS